MEMLSVQASQTPTSCQVNTRQPAGVDTSFLAQEDAHTNGRAAASNKLMGESAGNAVPARSDKGAWVHAGVYQERQCDVRPASRCWRGMHTS